MEDGVFPITYITECTVFGYQYQHPLWLNSFCSENTINATGWVYAVVATSSCSDSLDSKPREPYKDGILFYCKESELHATVGLEHCDIEFSEEALTQILGKTFAKLLRESFVIITGVTGCPTTVSIDCTPEIAVEIQKRLPTMIAALEKNHIFPGSIKIQSNKQITCIPVGQQPYHSFPIQVITELSQMQVEQQIQSQIADRASQYSNLIKGIAPSVVAVTLHDSDPQKDFIYLDIEVDDPRRLNKQKPELIGNGCTIVAPSIGEARKYWIAKAISNGENVNYSYVYDDKDLGIVFKFKVDVIFLPGKEEVITIVSDSYEWQREFWRNYQK